MASIFNILITFTNLKRGQQNYGVFCSFLEDTNSTLTAKYMEDLKGHARHWCFLPWDELEMECVP